jgi:aldose 1-epimerase
LKPRLLSLNQSKVTEDVTRFDLISKPSQEPASSTKGSVVVSILTHGATIIDIRTPNKNGVSERIALIPDTYEGLLANDGPYFGATVGRYANRIAEGKFAIDGVEYNVPINNYPNSLHGGWSGFNKKNWTIEDVIQDKGEVGVKLQYISAAGEEGFPGELTTTVTYTLNIENELKIEYGANTTAKTPINLTNHTYCKQSFDFIFIILLFPPPPVNLSGNFKDKIYDHYLHVPSSQYLPVDSTQIPTGVREPVAKTPFNLQTPFGVRLGDVIDNLSEIGVDGLDHTYVISENPAWEERPGGTVFDFHSGRKLTLHTTQVNILKRFFFHNLIFLLLSTSRSLECKCTLRTR